MQIKVRNQPRELLVQTILVKKNVENPLNIFLFHCPYCGKHMDQLQGLVGVITDGLTPREDVAVIHECDKCKRMYTFQTLNYEHKNETKVTLISTKDRRGVFHCWVCRNPLLEFMNEKIIKFPDFALAKLPFKMNCVNPECNVKYNFVDLV